MTVILFFFAPTKTTQCLGKISSIVDMYNSQNTHQMYTQCHTQVQLHFLSVLTTPMTRKPMLSAWRKEERGMERGRQEWKEGRTGEGKGETMLSEWRRWERGSINFSTIKDWDLLHQRLFVLFLQDYCALQELLMKINFTIAVHVAPPILVPLSTGTCYIRDFLARLLCSARITNENEFHNSSSPTLCASNDVTSGHAHPLCSEIWLL